MRQIHAALALCVFTGAAMAQDLAPLTDLKACRLDSELVSLSFSYEGGSCEQTGDASADLRDNATATATVPIVSTAEVCTMQAVTVEHSGAVAVPADVTALDVQLVSPGGEVQATGNVDIAPNSPDCAPPVPRE
ncbi:MAG: hypothetical protein JWQ89_3372 [Devosia sp.]|uniref:hypothetical protein n=1 Tax=Devosia sp. TaxID=1871048 RepID=UPI00261F6D12|nr:hypothetical protein [Devosia sp.]MDB5541645.1 hypothetical protein [Devosia sp.]